MKNSVNTIIVSLTVIITAIILSGAFKNRNRGNDIINVTGLGKKDFVSDLVVWSGSFSRVNTDLKAASAELNTDRDAIKKYLVQNGVKEKDIVFSAVEIDKQFREIFDVEGFRESIFDGYKLSQTVTIESSEVEKIEELSRKVTELINEGVEFYSYAPQYYYTGLAELKIEMIAAATQDAKLRAEKIAENAGGDLGKLRYASMGIFQITAQNSSEDYSWGGAFNTSSKYKTATITMKLQYESE
jgi:uncharacterized protein